MDPKISVLMGIYNCVATLGEAIGCILAQTETRWELILCDDGSRDDTYAVAESFRRQYPDRIVLLRNEKNMGLNHTLNRCLERATGEYIARMEAFGLESEHFNPEDWLRPNLRYLTLEEEPHPLLVLHLREKLGESLCWEQTKMDIALYAYRFYME